MKNKLMIAFLAVAIAFLGSGICFAGDLDDGISKYTDDPVSNIDQIGKLAPNVKFIIMNAKSKAEVHVTKGEQRAEDKIRHGFGALNSAVLGAGAVIKGDVIIIDQSKGDKTQIVE